jgi:thiamine biosynthesis lipoprotein
MRWHSAAFALAITVIFAATCAQSQTHVLVHRQKYAMGTVFEVVTYSDSPERANEILDQALHEAVRLDNVMSDYKSDSELSKLNRTAYLAPQPVSPDLYRVIETSLEYSQRSDGEFDITVGPLVNYWKAVMRGEIAESHSQVATLRSCVGFGNVLLTPPNQVAFRCPSLKVDLGAIGKGYAVDRIVELLRSRGISNALVNAGGSTFFGIGTPRGANGWPVSLKSGSGEGQQIILLNDSVSTSEQSAASQLGDRATGHIIDPKTGKPLMTAATVSVLAPTATGSDALSTTLLLLGPENGKHLIQESTQCGAIWRFPSGKIETVSSSSRQWLVAASSQITRQQEAQR